MRLEITETRFNDINLSPLELMDYYASLRKENYPIPITNQDVIYIEKMFNHENIYFTFNNSVYATLQRLSVETNNFFENLDSLGSIDVEINSECWENHCFIVAEVHQTSYDRRWEAVYFVVPKTYITEIYRKAFINEFLAEK